MGQQMAFVVGDRSAVAEGLLELLAEERIPAVLLTLEEVPGWLAAAEAVTVDELVLVSSAHTVGEVRRVHAALDAHLGREPRLVVYAESTVAELERHVRAGWDYLVPPFRADVLHRRFAAGAAGAAGSVIDDAAHLARYEKELQIGREIQEGFLPHSVPNPDGWQIEVRFHPARQVAGDFYDAFDLVGGRRVGFIVADVCDKGVGAALFMALIRSLLRNTASHAGSLSVVGLDVEWSDPEPEHRTLATTAGVGPLLNAVTGTDSYMVQNHLEQGYFATLFFGMLDPATGSVVYINCGHNPPVLRRSDGEQIVLRPTGPALGMMPGSQFRLGRVQLGMGDLLYLYTDGVTEAKDEQGEFFSEPRLRDIVADRGGGDARGLLEHFDTELTAHIGGAEQFDDITMMALYRRPDPSSAMGTDAAGPETHPPG